MKCSDCGCDFYFYGVDATGEPTASRATTSNDKKTLQIFAGPEKSSFGIPDGQLRQ
jgi:hypothetical protein